MSDDLERRVRYLEKAFAATSRDFDAASALGRRLRDRVVIFGGRGGDPPTWPNEPGVPVTCCPSRRVPDTLYVRSILQSDLSVAPSPSYTGPLTYNGGGWASPEFSLSVGAVYSPNSAGVCLVGPANTVRAYWLLSCRASWSYNLIGEGVSCVPVGSPFGLPQFLPKPGGSLAETGIGGMASGGSCDPFNIMVPYGRAGVFTAVWGGLTDLYSAIFYE